MDNERMVTWLEGWVQYFELELANGRADIGLVLEKLERMDAAVRELSRRQSDVVESIHMVRDVLFDQERRLGPPEFQEKDSLVVNDANNTALPNAKTSTDSSMMTDYLRQFLSKCDNEEVSFGDALEWFRSRSPKIDLEVAEHGSGSSWMILRVVLDDRAWLIPAIRKPMGGTTLEEYYDMSSITAFERVYPNNVERFARQRKTESGQWETIETGTLGGKKEG